MKREIKKETDCSKCLKKKNCNYHKEDHCINYENLNKDYVGCYSCLNKFTRGKLIINSSLINPTPCFRCNSFKRKGK